MSDLPGRSPHHGELPTVAVPGGRVEYDDVPAAPRQGRDNAAPRQGRDNAAPRQGRDNAAPRQGRDNAAPRQGRDNAAGGLAPLLFLHEGLGSAALWRGFHRRIAEAGGRRAVAYSRLGHGWSDPPPARRTTRSMHSEAATVVPALREALNLDAPVVVGHSDGASIGLLHAAGHEVSGLVVLAPHVFVEESGLVAIRAARAAFVEGGLRTRMARHHRDPDTTFHNWNDVWLDPAFTDWDLRPELPGITCPVLAVQGTDDPYGTVAHVEAVRDGARGPVELLVLPCAHAPHLEAPDETAAAILSYLADRP